MRRTYKLKDYLITPVEQLVYVEEKLGAVHKCLDQNNQKCLLHINKVMNDNGMLAKFCLTETNIYV